MQVREAKDFLVEQTGERARIEGVAFSDLEKRMMYFTQEQRLPATVRGLYIGKAETEDHARATRGISGRIGFGGRMFAWR
jgi:hypothetical protein